MSMPGRGWFRLAVDLEQGVDGGRRYASLKKACERTSQGLEHLHVPGIGEQPDGLLH